MERKEMIEKLMNKANVSYEKAEEALEKSNWDLLDAIIYLERERKEEEESKAVVCVPEIHNDNEGPDGLGKLLGRMFKFIGKIIRKGNVNYFHINKEGKEPIKISITISMILLIFAFWPTMILLVIGLFLGYKYSIKGKDIKSNEVNNVFNKASETAKNIKNNFNAGYKNC